MSYVVPQTLVFQEFEAAPAVVSTAQNACIIGPRRSLIRYANLKEKPQGLLGKYSYLMGNTHEWPHRESGDVVITDSVKLFIDDALLKYASAPAAAQATAKSLALRAKIKGEASGGNVIRAENLVFSGKQRTASIPCDVKPGDVVRVSATVGDENVTAESKVVGLLPERVAATVAAAAAAEGNLQAAREGSVTVDLEVGVDVPTLTAVLNTLNTGTHVYTSGVVEDSYTLVCIEGGKLHDAVFALISASGTDSVPEFKFTVEFGEVQDVGPKKALALGFEDDQGGDYVFEAGTQWKIDVEFPCAAVAAASGGNYSGAEDTTYVITVVRGGLISEDNPPLIMVSTTTGYDFSGPHEVTASGTSVAIGTRGVSIKFTGTALLLGDQYSITVKAESAGELQTLVLQDVLPAALLDLDEDTGEPPELNLALHIQKSFEVTRVRSGHAPLTNFDIEDTQIVVKPGIFGTDARVLDASKRLVELPAVDGTLFVEFAATVSAGVGVVGSIFGVNAVSALGVVDPANPLAYGVYKALSNTDNGSVMYIQTAGDSLEDYLAALEVLSQRNDVYYLAPMTFDREIQDACAAHVNNMSSPETGRWRRTLVCRPGVQEFPLVDEHTQSGVVLATITDDPAESGTQYTRVTITSEDVNLMDIGVRPRDLVRIQFVPDGFGGTTYTEFSIDAVISPTELRITGGVNTPITLPSKMEIWRRRTKDELAQQVGSEAASFGSRRVSSVWPDYPEVAGKPVPGYYLAAALAGLGSSVLPHQSLTRVAVSGFDSMTRTTQLFGAAQLNTMAEAGVLIVTQAPTGQIYVRHDLTTDTSDINTAEQMRTTNLDSISYVLLSRLAGTRGGRNITPQLADLIRISVLEAISALQTATYSETIGPQVLGVVGDVTCVQHPLFKDRFLITVRPELPYPCNNEELHIVVA